MKVQSIYNLLRKIEQNNGLYEKEVIRILKFINQDVYKKIDTLIEESDDCYVYGGYENDRESLELYLDASENSILSYLVEMIDDNKKEFIERFFKETCRYFKIIDNGLYDENDFNPMTLTFNIYIMLKAYHEYKEDFSYYDSFINDFTFLIDNGNLLLNKTYSSKSIFLSEKKCIIDSLIKMRLFDDFPKTKEYLLKLVKGITENVEDETVVLIECEENVQQMEKTIEESKKYFNHPMFNKETFNSILGDMFNSFQDSDIEYFYTPILSLGDRYQYILDAYDNYIDNSDILDEVIAAIAQFDNGLFDYLNKINGDGKDSFVSCMEMVFDSDSLFEVEKKLNYLLAATVAFKHKNVNDALSDIKSLSTNECKCVVFDKVITLDSNTVNKVNKPTLLIDRMCDAYERAFGDKVEGLRSRISFCYEKESYMVDVEEVVHEVIRCGLNAYGDKQAELAREKEEQVQQEELFPVMREPQYVSVKKEEVGGLQKIKSIFGKK